MSYDETRKLLDQLMGEGRNGEDNLLSDKHYSDEIFCRMYLCGICPYEVFTNTKIDMGPCSKKHMELKRDEYNEAKASGKEPGYERILYAELRKLIDDCDRRIQKGQQRLLETQGPEDEDPLSLQIKDCMKQVELLGEQGNVDESMKLMAQVEELKRQKVQADKQQRMNDESAPNGIQQQKLRVCEACASFLSLYDNDKRLADHYSGKLHTGFALIRRKMEQLEADRASWDRPMHHRSRSPHGGRDYDRRSSSHRRDHRDRDRRDDRDRHRRDSYRDRRRRSRSPRDRRSRSPERRRSSSRDRHRSSSHHRESSSKRD